jgi:glycerophosphoryl diester phosphodiesterase
VVTATLDHGQQLVIAHRGDSRRAPGNTLAAFQAAIDAGADAVELDVRCTADGVLVIHHGAHRRGAPLTRLDHADLVIRSRHEPPTLADVADLCAGRVSLDVEIKQTGYEAGVVDLLRRRYPDERLMITSFSDTVISSVKQRSPEIRCGLLLGPHRLKAWGTRVETMPFEIARGCNADFLVPHQLLVSLRPNSRRRPLAGSSFLARADVEGMPVVVWTVNGIGRLERYLADGRVAGIITDLPGVAVDVRRRLALQIRQTTG